VDVFICTYNEGPEILERTILGTTRIAHADLRVWVLDDGARDWVRDLAGELGALYVRRVKGRHAKAGNVNNGLAHALATGRRPEFILLLDADFVAARHILARTLPLFAEPDVGIVRTPQHFFNPDPLQRNLLCGRFWPDEQRFFFNVLMPSRDAWGAAFCCGTSAVFRVSALEQAGGMAVETVTEDMLTTFKLLEHGWRTVFLNERLSLGLAPEGLAEYVSQRARWCLGAMQQVYTRWSFAGPARIGLLNRIACFDTMLYWSVSFAFRLLVMTAPILFWRLGVSAYAATPTDLLYWLGPAILANMVCVGILSGHRLSPVMTDVSQLISSVAVMRTVAQALVRPFGHPFKVTAKGRATDKVMVQWRLLAPFAALAAATAGGMLLNLPAWSQARGEDGFVVNLAWSLFNLVVLSIAAACVELPRPRREERFAVDARAVVRRADGRWQHAVVDDLATGGARLHLTWGEADDPPTPGEVLEVRLLGAEAPVLSLQVLGSAEDGDAVAGRFVAGKEARRALIAWLYSGRFANEVEEVAPARAFAQALRRAFG
jgi:cellulose synthase (UDP-forming)